MDKSSSLKGIIPAVLTPVNQHFGIDGERLAAHAAGLLGQGCSRIATFGTTGEGVSFSAREKQDAHKALIASGIPAARILPAVMCCAISDAAAQLADAAALGCPDVLVLPPFYYANAGLAGLIDYFEAAYERASRPPVGVALYNIPAMSRITISIDLVRSLLDRGKVPVAGIKDSTGDLASGLAFVRAFPNLSIFTGDDRVLPDLLRSGGAGMIGGLPNLYASDLVALYGAVDGPRGRDLAALAAKRIADVDARGGLAALKADLAQRLSDPAWLRVMPPLRPLGAK